MIVTAKSILKEPFFLNSTHYYCRPDLCRFILETLNLLLQRHVLDEKSICQVDGFLKLCSRASGFTGPTMVVAFALMHRLILRTCASKINIGTEPILFMIAMLLAHKSTEDFAYQTKDWATFTGLPSQMVCRLEREFLNNIGHDVHVSKVLFDHWVNYLCRLAAEWKYDYLSVHNFWI